MEKLDGSDNPSQQYLPITDFFNTHACLRSLSINSGKARSSCVECVSCGEQLSVCLFLGGVVCLFAQQGFKLTPEDKSFAVTFPSQPVHQQNESNTGPIHIEAHAYSVENSSWKFVLSYVHLTPLPTDLKPSDALDSAIGGTLKNIGGKLLSEESMTVSGKPAKAVRITVGESTIVDGRFVYVKPRVYQLLVLHRNGATPPFEQQFFDSFTVPN
jgi:hypothetical protein